MNLDVLKTQAQKFVTDNATGILTAGGVAGTVVTSVLTARATFKAARIIDAEDNRRISTVVAETVIDDESSEALLTTPQKVQMVWPYYIPPVASGGATIAAIIMANRLNAQRVAAITAAYAISENRFKDFQKKVEQKLTGPKNEQVYDEIAQDKVNENPPNREVVIIGDGRNILCYDMFSGRYFTSNHEDIKHAELAVNNELYYHNYASLSFFYDELEIPSTGFSDEVGWNSSSTGPMSLRFSTVMSPDNKPCLAVDFIVAPIANYTQLY